MPQAAHDPRCAARLWITGASAGDKMGLILAANYIFLIKHILFVDCMFSFI